MKKTFIWLLTVIAALAASGEQARAQEAFDRGAGSLVYTGYVPLQDKPITLHYYIPTSGDITLMPVLFAMHGTKRHGNDARDAWREFAEKYGFIVLSPEYSKEYYDNNAYNYGNVSEKVEEFIPRLRELWTYNTIESIFDFFRARTGNLSDKYDIWGHSAGGQFVHRFLLCMPDARVNRAVAANAGTWTFLEPDGLKNREGTVFGWPYSIQGTPFAEKENLRKFFAREFYVNLGDADVDTTSRDFPKYPAAMAQGPTRYARGNNFFKSARDQARSLGCRMNWRRSVVAGASHSSKMMIYGRSTTRNGKRAYDTGDISNTAAFWLIYGDRLLK